MRLEEYLKQNPKKIIIFDLDLTLIELVVPWEKAISQADQYFKSLDPVMAETCMSEGYTGYNKFITKHGPEVKQRLDSIYNQVEVNNLEKAIPNKELIDFIISHNQYRYYLWSNNQKTTVEKVLKENNIYKYFEKIISATDDKFFKPDAGGFNKIFDPKTENKSDFLMVGDSNDDKMAAYNAGIDYLHCSI